MRGFPRLGRARRARGFTLLEMMISISVITVVVMVTIIVVHTTSEHMKFELIVSDQQTRTRTALDTMKEEMRTISAALADFSTVSETNTDTVTGTSLTVSPPSGYPSANGPITKAVRFNKPRFDEATKTVDLGTTATALTYYWRYADREIAGNGIDDNNNGLFDDDDGWLVREGPGGQFDIVCTNVPKSGFLVIKTGRRLQIRIGRKNVTPMRTDQGTTFTTIVTHDTYCLRNF
ncbi:MAG: prepilin-type N-terminal cleavage/methylation domain-containing protein [Planctomycetota bacterium]|nr:prepilin-type N-terminal cleavage/methylation domain-containing protein [Planctomycetota bacterium]